MYVTALQLGLEAEFQTRLSHQFTDALAII
jgi:hypothetical protein